MRITTGLFALLVVSAAGCTAQNLCNRIAECSEEEDIDVSDDAPAVCVAEYNGALDALNANDEEECRALASAQLTLDACKTGLSCDDLFEADLGKECDEELDDYEDAREKVDGDECTPQEN